MRTTANRSADGLGVIFVLGLVAAIPVVTGGAFGEVALAPVEVDASALPARHLPAATARPAQIPIEARRIDLGHGKTGVLKAAYAIEGAVLTRRRHYRDPHSDISPLDLGLVTGPMAAPGAMAHLEGGTVPRMAILRFRPGAPPEMRAGGTSWFTNNHLIPATADLRDALLDVRRGEAVRIEGFLADVEAPGLRPWRTSERREDTWCEIIVVTRVVRTDGGTGAPVVAPTVRKGGRIGPAG